MCLVWEYYGHNIVDSQKTYILYLIINQRDDELANGSDL